MWAAKPGTPPPAPVLEQPPSTIHFTDSCTVFWKYWSRVERAKYREGLRVCKQQFISHKPRAKMVVFRHVKFSIGFGCNWALSRTNAISEETIYTKPSVR
ncbi:hypothetical protein GQ607_002328 [Colletotrichum asianum]|uniref:Uncharacterized protein n=1 Tax=Colletotrichum asianum TaxID=702518 RepID=A0A8H3WN63_9PEZI|nr:hypothetical protein GQ607_002328 [Colletotrichum asianum]